MFTIVASCLLAHIRCVQSVSQTSPNCHRLMEYTAFLLSQAFEIHSLALVTDLKHTHVSSWKASPGVRICQVSDDTQMLSDCYATTQAADVMYLYLFFSRIQGGSCYAFCCCHIQIPINMPAVKIVTECHLWHHHREISAIADSFQIECCHICHIPFPVFAPSVASKCYL